MCEMRIIKESIFWLDHPRKRARFLGGFLYLDVMLENHSYIPVQINHNTKKFFFYRIYSRSSFEYFPAWSTGFLAIKVFFFFELDLTNHAHPRKKDGISPEKQAFSLYCTLIRRDFALDMGFQGWGVV